MIGAIAVSGALIVAASRAPIAVQGPDEPSLRAAVQRFYDAQAAKDLAATVAAWSPAAPDRPTNETYKAIFDTGEDQFTVDIRDLAIVGSGAQVRVLVKRVRTAHEDGRDRVYRGEALDNQQWRYEDGAWKLVRDREAAEDFADRLFSAGADSWEALLAAEPGQVTRALRHAVAQRASGWGARQQYKEALSGFQLALAIDRRLQDRENEIESLQNVANAFYFLRDYQHAGESYAAALAAAQAADVPEQVALAHLGLGTVAYTRGEYAAALTAYEAAKAIYETRDEGASIGRALVSIGNVQFVAGEYDQAAGSYRRAFDLLVAGQDYSGAWLARGGLARVFATQGDLASALREYNALLADRQARPTTGQFATTLESIGEIDYRTGDSDGARTAFKRAVPLYEVIDQASAARVLGDIGLTELSAGRRDEALAAYTQSRDRYDKARRPDGVAHAWVGIGFSLAAARKFDAAVAAYQTAIKMLDEQQRAEDSARAWLGLSMAQEGSGAVETALASAKHVRTAAETLKSDELLWRSSVREGTALRKLGRLDESVRALEDGIAVIERMAVDLATNADVRTALDDSPSAWGELAFTRARQGDAAGAFLAAERRLAAMRRLMLAPFERDIVTGMTEDEQRDEVRLARDIVSARAQIRAERSAPHPDALRLARLQQQLAALLDDRSRLQAAVYARVPDVRAWRAIDLPSTVPLDALGERSLVLEYIVGDDEQLVLWVSRGPDGPVYGAATSPTSRLALAEAIANALEPAALNDTREWRTRSATLAGVLLAPARAALEGIDACVVIPDDMLWRVPFEALALGDAELATRGTVTYTSSLVTLARHPRWTSNVSVRLGVVAPATVPTFPDDEEAARDAIATSAVAVIAAPLSVSGAAPMFSSLLLRARGDAPADDGRLEVRELFGIASAHGLAILPDGRSFDRTRLGPAMLAMEWAAAAAGLPALIIGRSPAFATGAQLKALLGHFADGVTLDAAWRGAIEDTRAVDPSPAAWAGLRLLGLAR